MVSGWKEGNKQRYRWYLDGRKGITKKEEEHTPSSCTICIPVNIFRGYSIKKYGVRGTQEVCTHTIVVFVKFVQAP
jgi:hypothetical protein